MINVQLTSMGCCGGKKDKKFKKGLDRAIEGKLISNHWIWAWPSADRMPEQLLLENRRV